jgi:heme oxygenase (biliverdin-producing, ferredoxin)
MTVMQDDRPDLSGESLSDRLRERTRVVHEVAETAPFVGHLLAGELPLSGYTALVAQNYAIYQALETTAERWRGDPVAGRFVLDELTRVPSLERDLQTLLGSDWSAAALRLRVPATQRYVDQILAVGATWPAGFVAHHYVRYLGDLSGGQVIRQRLQQHYGDLGRTAASFYVFDDIAKLKPFRDRYRGLLDELDLAPQESERLVAEAVRAFELNHAVFTDLGALDLEPESRSVPHQHPPLEGGA